jgi:hypothetical protein
MPFIAPRLGAKTVESIWTEAASSDLTLCPKCDDVAEPVPGGKRQCISCYHTFTPEQKTAAADPSSPEYKEWLDNQSWDPTAPVGQQRGLSEIFPPVEMDTSEYRTAAERPAQPCENCGKPVPAGHVTFCPACQDSKVGAKTAAFPPPTGAAGFDPDKSWCEGTGESPNSGGGCARCYNANPELSDSGFVKAHNPMSLADSNVLSTTSSKTAGTPDWDAIMQHPTMKVVWPQLRNMAVDAIISDRGPEGEGHGISSSDVNHTIYEVGQRHYDAATNHLDVAGIANELADRTW